MHYLLYSHFVISLLWKASDAIQCFSCLSNEAAGKFCRKVSEAQMITCPNDATFCNALVFLKNGKVNVHRGCAGSVSSWGFGRSECDIMSAEDLMDVGVAFYQCRGDLCNNIEPADGAPVKSDVVLLTKTVEEDTSNKAPAPARQVKEEEEDEGYAPRRTTTTKKRIVTVPRVYPEETTEAETESPYQPKITTRPAPEVTKPRAREETTEAEETDAPYQPKKTTPAPPPPPTPKARTPAPYPQETTEETEAPYQPVRSTPAPPPPPATTPRARTPAPYPQETTEAKEEEVTESAYQPVRTTTTTTTTTRKRRPDYGATELIDTGVTEVIIRPTPRRRTSFDRR